MFGCYKQPILTGHRLLNQASNTQIMHSKYRVFVLLVIVSSSAVSTSGPIMFTGACGRWRPPLVQPRQLETRLGWSDERYPFRSRVRSSSLMSDAAKASHDAHAAPAGD
ncbi:hypothetical protein K466DRAFT_583501 [Polyporus arcularius HHB13444]|uniref:Uncharacterized protein n=1 Tax=Polyporus arcularius HHB13444 TaxID=1314778 RepID=A0A5C3PMW9_9APHY|nr:hypothetical protein K466DRAFT_583501 [Polyporus arcularius HHB13444]